jgi:uncharacterized NAD-dependent epimerase/dehydratase family protein
MTELSTVSLTAPYLIFLGDETVPAYGKTGAGIAHWRPELCLGQLNLEGGTIDIGLPKMTIKEAAQSGAKTLVIGTSIVGGAIPDSWIKTMLEALESGMDIAAGVHTKLNDIPELAKKAEQTGQALIDVRTPPKDLPVGTGKKRTGKRLLTVGTDCALGKKYTALAIEKDLKQKSIKSTFRATGQTGILISGSGMPIDAVVADFVSGAAEVLSPDNVAGHWDIIEGQGSLHHPGFAAVSMGLLLGSQPDVFVVCTELGREKIKGWPEFDLPSIQEVIDRTIDIGKRTNQAIRCIGISVNSSSFDEAETKRQMNELEKTYGLPVVDPIRFGVEKLTEVIVES